MGRLDEAHVAYAKVIELNPGNFLAQNNLGSILQKAGNNFQAEKSYRRAITLNSNFSPAHFNLGNVLKECGRLEEAAASYKRAIISTRGFISAHGKLAETLRELGLEEQAIESERCAIFLNSKNNEEETRGKFSEDFLFRQPSPMEHSMFYRPGLGTENIGSFLRAMTQMLRPKIFWKLAAYTIFLLEGP